MGIENKRNTAARALAIVGILGVSVASQAEHTDAFGPVAKATVGQEGGVVVPCDPYDPRTGLAGFGAYKQSRGGVDGIQFVSADNRWHSCAFKKKIIK